MLVLLFTFHVPAFYNAWNYRAVYMKNVLLIRTQ